MPVGKNPYSVNYSKYNTMGDTVRKFNTQYYSRTIFSALEPNSTISSVFDPCRSVILALTHKKSCQQFDYSMPYRMMH